MLYILFLHLICTTKMEEIVFLRLFKRLLLILVSVELRVTQKRIIYLSEIYSHSTLSNNMCCPKLCFKDFKILVYWQHLMYNGLSIRRWTFTLHFPTVLVRNLAVPHWSYNHIVTVILYLLYSSAICGFIS